MAADGACDTLHASEAHIAADTDTSIRVLDVEASSVLLVDVKQSIDAASNSKEQQLNDANDNSSEEDTGFDEEASNKLSVSSVNDALQEAAGRHANGNGSGNKSPVFSMQTSSTPSTSCSLAIAAGDQNKDQSTEKSSEREDDRAHGERNSDEDVHNEDDGEECLMSGNTTAELCDAEENNNHNNTENRNDDETLNAVSQLIDEAKQKRATTLDLSRKGLRSVPAALLQLADLQYIYLEGNGLIDLPKKFFQSFPLLVWLDLRNNKLRELPTSGLGQHAHLRYLLLEQNELRSLPFELGELRQLSALNIVGNPLVYPSSSVIEKGTRFVQEYLRKENACRTSRNAVLSKQQNYESTATTTTTNEQSQSEHEQQQLQRQQQLEDDSYSQIKTMNCDVWGSDDDNATDIFNPKTLGNRSKTRFRSDSFRSDPSIIYMKECDARIKSATANILITKSLRRSEVDTLNSEQKARISNAKDSANKASTKLLSKRKSLPNTEAGLFRNEEYEKALQERKLDKYKRKKEKIEATLQRENDKIIVDKFKNDLRLKQNKMSRRRLVKGVDYEDAAKMAPFDVSDEHMAIMSNKEREFLDKRLAMERMRALSPETLWKMEEERRERDNELQEKIRDYTNRLLNNRDNPSQNAKRDRVQAAKDIFELKKIEQELAQRRTELQFNLKPTIGAALAHRETSKLNARATFANLIKAHRKT